MKQKLLQSLMLIAALLTSSHAFAHDFEVGGIYYNITSSTDKTCEVTFQGSSYRSYSNEYTGSIVIHETVTYNGTTYSVTSIRDYAFYDCSGLTSVIIPNSVISIGKFAFYDCTGLTSVTIGNSVTSIGDDAFSWCPNLINIELPNSVTSFGYNVFGSTGWFLNQPSGLVYLNHCCIGYKGSLWGADISIKEGITCIAYGAFYECGIKSVNLPNSLQVIDEQAFAGNNDLTSVTIPENVTCIRNKAFAYCNELKNIKFEPLTSPDLSDVIFVSVSSDATVEVPFEAYYDYKIKHALSELSFVGYNINGLYYLPEDNYATVTYKDTNYNSYSGSITIPSKITIQNKTFDVRGINSNAFRDCKDLSSIIIPNSVTSIGDSAFTGCSGLTSVTIPNSITSIGERAFSQCSGLTSVTIPNSVTSIGNFAFNGCASLKELIIEDGESSLSLGYNKISNYSTPEYGLFYDCPLETIHIGRNLSYDNVTYSYSPFCRNTALQSITIGNSVTSIGSWAFSDCTSLTSITIGNSVKSIGNHAFLKCSKLTSIIIPNSVTSIGEWAFNYCTGLTNIEIPTSVNSIGEYAFAGCGRLWGISRTTTQTKFKFAIRNNTVYESFININNKTYTTKDTELVISELSPETWYSYYSGLKINNIYCTMSSANNVSTKSLNVNIDVENGDFYIKTKGSYTEGDATILGTMLSFQKEPTEYDNLNEKTFNLDPNTNHTVYYSVNTKEGGVYSASKTFTTGALTWSDEDYQATSTTSARLMTATNCDATEGTGFEWRRYGAPENLKPNAVACPVIDGMLIGSLRNLNSEAYYEFRPYYTSSSGNTHYGEWTALFTGDANVYFEPEVRTYEDVMVATNKATLKGYALAGTDDIISQGFEYWESSVQPGTANSLTASVNSKKVEVSGISMTTTISDLKYGTTYCYRAFATTASGTIYGETVEFTTEKDLSGIENVIVEEDETVEYYNLQGVKVVNPSSGLYIKRQGNKVTKVVL